MNIAILHYAAPPVVGGVESVIGHHARLMTAANHRVRILAGGGAAVIPEVEFIEVPLFGSRHPRILEIKSDLDRGCVPDTFADLVAEIGLLLEEQLRGIELLIAHNVASLNKNLPLSTALMDFSSRAGGTPVVLWHHDLAWTTPRYQSELYDGFPWNVLSTAWPGVRSHVVVSELRRRELAGLVNLPPDEIQVIPNGVEIAAFLKFEPKTRQILAQLDLLEAAPLLLLPVRITRRKNIELALRAVADLRHRLPDACLLVTGPMGPHNPANQEYFSELLELRDALGLQTSAHFLAELSPEFLPDEVIADFFHLADGLLLTSREEGFGIPLLEAGLSGIPIFCSDIPPLRELAGDAADYFSPDALPESIGRLIHWRLKSDPVYSMRVKVRQSFSWESIYRTHIEPLCLQAAAPR